MIMEIYWFFPIQNLDWFTEYTPKKQSDGFCGARTEFDRCGRAWV